MKKTTENKLKVLAVIAILIMLISLITDPIRVISTILDSFK